MIVDSVPLSKTQLKKFKDQRWMELGVPKPIGAKVLNS
jgi:hypothetical protein